MSVNVVATDPTLTKLYRVGPGDVLDVHIQDRMLDKSSPYAVSSAGFLEVASLSKPIVVTGLTESEIGILLAGELKKQSLAEDPNVSVSVRDYASHTLIVSGSVREPGTKILRREAIPLYVVIADAQPFPEATRVTVVHGDSHEIYVADLTDPAQMNVLVHPSDVITVRPSPAQFFYVGGEVKSPGEKSYHRGLTLTQAIIAAGGLIKKSGKAHLARDTGKGFLDVTKYKLAEIYSGKVADPVVKPGDRITINH